VTTRSQLRAPFPWYGGKSLAAPLIWRAFGSVPNYVEPFAGSLATLLARPHAAKIETVNDKDGLIANFWRATQTAPDEVARWADWPGNEADQHARHRRLVDAALPKRLDREDAADLSELTRAWAIEHGENPQLRIALCGWEGEHEMPRRWTRIAWRSKGSGKNRGKERIWFSPQCLPVNDGELFATAGAELGAEAA